MSVIRVLPDILSNKIAAGEVVERPASIVKELVENSLDAKSSFIEVSIEKGGLSEIRVLDNGLGMNPDDALLSLERYATSKLLKDEDLFAIRTLGFRGEALPSIASVSYFEMFSQKKEALSGVALFAKGGQIISVKETGMAPGTLISVKRLFFNVPARRKFLKSEATEMGHIADSLFSIALAYPEVQFKLLHNGRLVKQLGIGDSFSRALDILGHDLKDKLFYLKDEDKDLSLKGWLASPEVSRSNTQRIYFYVNGRCVRDKALYKALFEGCKGRLMTSRYPVAVLFLELEPEKFDVNVHPVKNEVRFADPGVVWALIRRAVASSLSLEDNLKWNLDLPASFKSSILSKKNEASGEEDENLKKEPLENNKKDPLILEDRDFSFDKSDSDGPDFDKLEKKSSFLLEDQDSFSYEKKDFKHSESSFDKEGQKKLWGEKSFYSALRVIGQLHFTYILCESEAGLIIIDQHAAHERVRYENLKSRHKKKESFSQQLLTPLTCELDFKSTGLAIELLPFFTSLGLDIEHFGGNTFVIKAVPDILNKVDPASLFKDVLGIAVNAGLKEAGMDAMASVLDDCLVLMACHSAIRANHSLASREILDLFKQLDSCEQPSRCPHGRPIWVQWEKRFLERAFAR